MTNPEICLESASFYVQLNGTGWAVQGGRKDGCVSFANAAEEELPPPTLNVSQLIDLFAQRGLSEKQMVILSGAVDLLIFVFSMLIVMF